MAEAETIIRERLARVIAERVPSPG
jgi:hypothetical protein